MTMKPSSMAKTRRHPSSTKVEKILVDRPSLLLVLLILVLPAHALASKVLVVGATGTTGIRAIQGLLDTGYQPKDLILLTRNANQRRILQLKNMGFQILQADLEQETSLERALLKLYDTSDDSTRFWQGCYIHSTSSDTPDLDTLEVMRAQNLCNVLQKVASLNQNKQQDADGSTTVPFCVVYNSAAARPDHGVGRIAQKHQVEDVFRQAVAVGSSKNHDDSKHPPPLVVFVSLRANIFMEELWKKYTRPSILDGEYPLPLNRFTPFYLTSVRDMGRLAGMWIHAHGTLDTVGTLKESRAHGNFKIQNVASEKLRPQQVARCFAEAQGTPCNHVNTYHKLQPMKEEFPELWEQVGYVRTNHKEKTDIGGLKRQVQAASASGASLSWELSSFAQFLKETEWGNRDLTFEDLRRPDTLRY